MLSFKVEREGFSMDDVDRKPELRDTVSVVLCSFGADPEEACKTPCVYCLEQADAIIDVIRKYEEIHE